MNNTDHIGDGVYATFDGFGIELRANDHRNEVAVYLEPEVLAALDRFYETRIAEALRKAEQQTE